MLALTLIQLAASADNGGSLVPLYYIVTIAGVLAGGIFGLVRWLRNEKRRWTQEGQHAQKQAEALAANTEAAKKNTEAISGLTAELRSFVMETRSQFNHHDNRIQRLEDIWHGRRNTPSPPS